MLTHDMPVKRSDVILVIITIFFPPAATFIVAGCGWDLLINTCLTISGYITGQFLESSLGHIPGCIHALWLIYKKMKAEEQFGRGINRFVQDTPPPVPSFAITSVFHPAGTGVDPDPKWSERGKRLLEMAKEAFPPDKPLPDPYTVFGVPPGLAGSPNTGLPNLQI